MSSESAYLIISKQDGLEWLVLPGEATTVYTNFGYSQKDGASGWDASELVANVNSDLKPNDWRLPTIDELKTLINTTRAPKEGVYWSCSPQSNYSYNAMVVSFPKGVVNNDARSYVHNVRLVRTVQFQ
jgi:hypothetical protein